MTTTPIHHWTMDNLSGTSVLDEIAGGASLTLANRTAVAGQFNNGLGGGTGVKTLKIGTPTAFKALSMWVKKNAVTRYSTWYHNPATTTVLGCAPTAYGGALFVYRNGTWEYPSLNIVDSGWHHLWIVEGTTTNKHWLWLDGVKAVAEITTNMAGVLEWFGLNGDWGTGWETIDVDNIQWYDRVPTDTEIAYLPAATSQTTTLPIPSVLMLAVLIQYYNVEGPSVISLLEQQYGFCDKKTGVLDQLYGLRLLTALIQYYGNTPAVRRLLAQYYGSASLLRRLLAEPYGDALALRQTIDQEWTLPEALRRIMEQRYSIAGDALRALMAENYHLSEYNLLRQQLDQVYVMGAGAALTQRPALSVTADGVAIDPHHINIEVDEGDYAIRGEIHLARQDQYLRCRHLLTEVVITIGSDVYHLLVESPRRSRPEVGRADYIVPCVSASILLDAPYAETITREFAGAMASAIVAELAGLAGIAIEWQCVDWYLPAATLYANGETPLSVIRKIVAAVGGVIQTTPAGVLLCRPEYPVTVPGWASAVPDHYLTDMDNYFSVDSAPVIRDGFNRFLISNQDAAAVGITLEQVDIDAMTKEIRVYQVPWNDDGDIILRTSGGSWVSIIDENIVTETITDLVEIVGGEGRTTKPIYAMGSHAYKQAVLGAVTPEDGHLTTEIKDNTLLEVVYVTKYYKFIVSDARIEDVQFFPEEVAL